MTTPLRWMHSSASKIVARLLFRGPSRTSGKALVVSLLLLASPAPGRAQDTPPANQASGLPELAIPSRLVVLAPHPDDVTHAAGLIQRVLARGGQVRVIDMTCGDARSPLAWNYVKRRGFRPTENAALNYGYWRQHEDQLAMREIGVPAGDLFFLGYPDSGLWRILNPKKGDETLPYRSPNTGAESVPYLNAVSPGAPYVAASVISDLARLLAGFQPDTLVAPHPNDHHEDHAATWYFGARALEAAGLQNSVRMLAPFDFYAGDLPTSLRRDFRMKPTRNPPTPTDWWEFELTDEEFEAKIRLTDQYRSQMAWEHPLVDVYDGKISYMYGYVARNELFATLGRPVHDGRYRRQAELSALPNRLAGVLGNLFTDWGRHLFGKR